jgi:hypothetical protein
MFGKKKEKCGFYSSACQNTLPDDPAIAKIYTGQDVLEIPMCAECEKLWNTLSEKFEQRELQDYESL